MRLKFVTDKSFDIRDVISGRFGCSEYAFYKLAVNLSLYYDVTIYDTTRRKLPNYNNIKFKNIKHINEDTDATDVFIINRIYDKLSNDELFQKLLSLKNKKFNIIHDFINAKGKIEHLLKTVPAYQPVFVSDTQRKRFNIDSERCQTIYNCLADLIPDQQEMDHDYLVYASAPRKGLNKILDKLHNVFSDDLKLHVCVPHYATKNTNINNPYVIYEGNIKHKEYSKLLSGCKAVIAPPFFETFGCVFAEAAQLGVNTIFFNQSGAVPEICPDALCAGSINDKNLHNNFLSCLHKIKNMQKLDHHSHNTKVLQQWIKLIEK